VMEQVTQIRVRLDSFMRSLPGPDCETIAANQVFSRNKNTRSRRVSSPSTVPGSNFSSTSTSRATYRDEHEGFGGARGALGVAIAGLDRANIIRPLGTFSDRASPPSTQEFRSSPLYNNFLSRRLEDAPSSWGPRFSLYCLARLRGVRVPSHCFGYDPARLNTMRIFSEEKLELFCEGLLRRRDPITLVRELPGPHCTDGVVLTLHFPTRDRPSLTWVRIGPAPRLSVIPRRPATGCR